MTGMDRVRYLFDTKAKAERRRWLQQNGEPCGSPRSQCPNNDFVHMAYYNLPEREKYLMMLEREKVNV